MNKQIHDHILRACYAHVDKGGKIVQRPPGIDGEVCPMQAVCTEKVGAFGLMWFPWDEGPAHELGITREQVWNFITGFDGAEPGQYHMSGAPGAPSDPEFYELGQQIHAELDCPNFRDAWDANEGSSPGMFVCGDCGLML